MILLDTCAFLWLMTDQKKLSNAAQQMIGFPEQKIYVSAASAWEIGIKHEQKKLKLPQEPGRFFYRALEKHDLEELPISSLIAIRSTQLPPLHRDPLDRILIATALQHDLVILTPDHHIRDYPLVKTMW